MDNVTHTLFGLVVAEFVAEHRARRGPLSPSFRGWAYLASALANNLPDGDFVLTRLTPGPLGYVLHHRGYTHTLFVGALLGAVGFALSTIWWRRRGGGPPAAERPALAGLWIAGPLLHVGMDFLNSYGVHAFWPLSSRWSYGDTLFIVEPWLWAVLAAPLLFAFRAPVARALLGALLAACVVLPFLTRFVPHAMAVALGVSVPCLVAVTWRLGSQARAVFGLGAALGVIGLFAVASRVAAHRIERRVASVLPDERVRDVVLSPLPGAPACWYFSVVATRGDDYVVTRGHLTLVPSWLSSRDCALRPSGSTAPLRPLALPAADGIELDLEYLTPTAELVALARDNCDFAALARFARVPYFARRPDGRLVIGDLRFDRGPSLDLSELVTSALPASCPRRVPGWTPPRADVLTLTSLHRQRVK